MGKPFTEFGLDPLLIDGIADLGFREATPIQEQAIPIALSGSDLIGAAQTGTGKTAAFLIPLINRLANQAKGKTRVMILTPTRELALQIDEQLQGLGYHLGIASVCIVGGLSFYQQESAIRKKIDVLIATPGRMIDHLRYNHVDFSQIEMLILDEADRMLDMGFLPDVTTIIDKLPKARQTLLFSATIAPQIKQLAARFMRHPKEIQVGRQVPVAAVRQQFIKVHADHKEELLIHLLNQEGMDSVLVFVRTKRDVRRLQRRLNRSGFASAELHSDRSQEDRIQALEKFRARQITTLVATDLASRGLDINDVSHVINYDIPQDADDYVHRVGRTARSEKDGDAVTFVTDDDLQFLQKIEKAIERKVTLETPPTLRRTHRHAR